MIKDRKWSEGADSTYLYIFFLISFFKKWENQKSSKSLIFEKYGRENFTNRKLKKRGKIRQMISKKIWFNNYYPNRRTKLLKVIRESHLICFKPPKKGAKSLPWVLSTKREDSQESDLAPFFWDLRQSEKNSDIKPALTLKLIFWNPSNQSSISKFRV